MTQSLAVDSFGASLRPAPIDHFPSASEGEVEKASKPVLLYTYVALRAGLMREKRGGPPPASPKNVATALPSTA